MQKVSTKERIFRKSIRLFADNGYESVSMKKIANASGIQPASIYNHFVSKEEILKSIYRFFVENQNCCRPEKQDYIPVLLRGTAFEILEIFNYPMHSDPEILPLMLDIIRIIWDRIRTDRDANAIYRKYVVDDVYRFIDEVFREGISLGRIIMPVENIHTFAGILMSARSYVASISPIYPDASEIRGIDLAMFQMLADTLTITPPIE